MDAPRSSHGAGRGRAGPCWENYYSQEAPPPAPGAPALPRATHAGSWSFFAPRSSPERPDGCVGDPQAPCGPGRAGRAQCGRAWAGGGYQVTVSVRLSVCLSVSVSLRQGPPPVPPAEWRPRWRRWLRQERRERLRRPCSAASGEARPRRSSAARRQNARPGSPGPASGGRRWRRSQAG